MEQEEKRLRSVVLEFGNEQVDDEDSLLTSTTLALQEDSASDLQEANAVMTFSVHVKGLASGPVACSIKEVCFELN